MIPADDMTSSTVWADGAARARRDMAAIRLTEPIPASYTSAACSILASPHLLAYPEAVREWLWSKATRWPRGMEEPHHAIDRADLGLR